MTSRQPFTICVYCGSRDGADPHHTDTAREVGTWIGKHGFRLVYGGGSNGLMGTVADAVLAHGGQVIGIIPQALVDKECAHDGCTELHVVSTMHERKHRMADLAHAFVALPGGLGTLEELFEVWTWRQLGYHHKPIGILNTRGYYEGLLQFLQASVVAGFVGPWQMDLVQVADHADDLLQALVDEATRLTQER